MATPTVPTVPFPTDTDIDDDDDDDVSSLVAQPATSIVPVQSPPPVDTIVPTPAPPPAVTSVPDPNSTPTNTNGIVPSNSATPLTNSLPSGSSTPTSLTNPPPNGDGGLSTGVSAGIGVGVALAMILMAVGAWMYVRTRRRRGQRTRKTSTESRSSYNSPDEEHGRGSGVRAYRVSELPNGAGVEKVRYYNELASPVVAQEVHGDREFAVELQGSDVPSRSTEKEGGSWSPNPPIYNQNDGGPPMEKKSGGRLFDDAPIDDREDEISTIGDPPTVTDQKEPI